MGDRTEPAFHPFLSQLLADPLTKLVMRADKVDAEELGRLLQQVQSSRTRTTQNHRGDDRAAMTVQPVSDSRYRSAVGIMLLNARNAVFIGQRIGLPDAWQMPQGGIEPDEEPSAAALRELREEIGTDNVEVLTESKGWLRYELPADLKGRAWGGRWHGQQQKWFAMRFGGADADINIATEHPEFSAWRWAPTDALPGLIVSFKRQLYLDVMQEFQGLQEIDP
jgi:putative (di)nucleoside polyphosphate hydrolase